ncbi:hypothetical protein [Actinocatenispora rupis]|uniref:Uncharacterized protein n=1 Tax=Actinocatenispora rupis TaxID=519421 RepID=A0A8J3NCI3_9ACTN|nr:hypothetical protein [Actinocatenispora rupis]GID14076.1 hypothetical protein Aru02nite_49650 [Actinocatenispora rupis]
MDTFTHRPEIAAALRAIADRIELAGPSDPDTPLPAPVVVSLDLQVRGSDDNAAVVAAVDSLADAFDLPANSYSAGSGVHYGVPCPRPAIDGVHVAVYGALPRITWQVA